MSRAGTSWTTSSSVGQLSRLIHRRAGSHSHRGTIRPREETLTRRREAVASTSGSVARGFGNARPWESVLLRRRVAVTGFQVALAPGRAAVTSWRGAVGSACRAMTALTGRVSLAQVQVTSPSRREHFNRCEPSSFQKERSPQRHDRSPAAQDKSPLRAGRRTRRTAPCSVHRVKSAHRLERGHPRRDR